MDELHYVYALTYADCPAADLGPGVDPRHEVELVPSGRIVAAASVVGLDQFDLSKMQQGSADVAWLSRVALRHNQIVQRLAEAGPVLPLRLATLFRDKTSLVEKLAQCGPQTAAFLDALGDRQEWAVKVYLDRRLARDEGRGGEEETGRRGERENGRRDEGVALSPSPPLPLPPSRFSGPPSPAPHRAAGAGLKYLAGRREGLNRAARLQAAVGRELSAVEDHLQRLAPGWRRLRPLSSALTARPETMVWNGALLVSKSQERPLRAACEQLSSDLGPKGLLVELTGPWPVYHFCEGLGITGQVSQDEGQ
jgi:hypothetical protein